MLYEVITIPDGCGEVEALARTTHMTIAAHQDDIEIMAYEGIAKCFGRNDKWHLGVVVTDGAGSPRSGMYANFTDEDMQKIRISEQKKAAYVGEYGAQVLLNYPSSKVKDSVITSYSIHYTKLYDIRGADRAAGCPRYGAEVPDKPPFS